MGYEKIKKYFFRTEDCFFSRFIRNTGLVEPQSKSATASNNLRLDDDAIEIETSEIVQQQKI